MQSCATAGPLMLTSDTDHHEKWATPRRYLHREWKRNKPHLAPSDSLPTLRLCPDRPLFVCGRCSCANVWVPLCLWCEWSSAEATKAFESNTPRPRRLSAPSRLVARSSKRPRCESSSRLSVSSTRCPIETAVPHGSKLASSLPKRKVVHDMTMPHDEKRQPPPHVAVALAHGHTLSHVTSARLDLDKTLMSALVNEDAEIESRQRCDVRARSARRYRRLQVVRHLMPHGHGRGSHSSDPGLPYGGNRVFTFQNMHSMSSVLSDGSDSLHGTDCLASDGPRVSLAPYPPSSHRICLESTGLRSSFPLPVHQDEPKATLPSLVNPVLAGVSPPIESERLGHPSRPYYSAIRKNMSRPASPAFGRTPSPIPTQLDHMSRETRSLDGGHRSCLYSRPVTPVLSGDVRGRFSGFSLSGETEMRMDLARWRREHAPDNPGDYQFHEMTHSRMKEMKNTVCKVGRGLKHMVLRKPSS